MNERENYLDRLLAGIEDKPEMDLDGQETDEEFLAGLENSALDEDEEAFLQDFEHKFSDMNSNSDMDFDMDDVDHIISNVKNGTMDDFDSKDSSEFSLEKFAEENAAEADFMVNTLDGDSDMDYGQGASDKELLEMLSGISEDGNLGGMDDMSHDEMDSMAKELADEIDSLGLEREEEPKGSFDEAEINELLDSEVSEKEQAGEKKGFFHKLSRLLFGEDDEEEEAAANGGRIPEIGEIENLSDENLDILRDLEGQKAASKEEEKAKKKQLKKEQKEQKAKERAEKKAEKAKKKAEKPKKEKKPKEPKVVEKTKPLPKGPVVLIMLIGLSLVVLVNLLSNLVGYSTQVSEAKNYYEQGRYAEAYACFSGQKVKEVDQQLYDRARVAAYVGQQLDNYKTYQQQNMYAEALNALICGVGRYDKNIEEAISLGIVAEYDGMMEELTGYLSTGYNVTVDQARELYAIRDKEEFTYAVYDIIDGLGLVY